MIEKFLAEIYETKTGLAGESDDLNDMLLRSFSSITHIDKLRAFADGDYRWIWDRIARRHVEHLVFRKPGILLVYFAAHSLSQNKFLDLWPLTEPEAQIIFSDLGISTAHL